MGGSGIYAQIICPAIMLVTFAAATLITKSSWMGAFAALSLMALLGFMASVIPFGYAVGFKGDGALARATSIAILMVGGFVVFNALKVSNPYITAFETGTLVGGGFVGYLGLLIASAKWYTERQNWFIMQIIVLGICFAGVMTGSIFALKSIQVMAGVFLALWTIEKMVEIPGHGFVPYLLKGMGASGALYLIVTYATPLYAAQFIH